MIKFFNIFRHFTDNNIPIMSFDSYEIGALIISGKILKFIQLKFLTNCASSEFRIYHTLLDFIALNYVLNVSINFSVFKHLRYATCIYIPRCIPQNRDCKYFVCIVLTASPPQILVSDFLVLGTKQRKCDIYYEDLSHPLYKYPKVL